MAKILSLQMTPQKALSLIKQLAADTANIVIIGHAVKRQKQRKISRRQIELCLQRGTIVEGPFLNQKGHWQVNMYRHAAGEELTCTVAIELQQRLIVVTVF